MRLSTNGFDLSFYSHADAFLVYDSRGGGGIALAAPSFHVDGSKLSGEPREFGEFAAPRRLANGAVEHRFGGPLKARPDLSLEVVVRIADDDPIVRFRYLLRSESGAKLTKPNGQDELCYFRTSMDESLEWRSVALSSFNELTHSYALDERVIPEHARASGVSDMGPIIVASDGRFSALFAYEHGSMKNDPFLLFELHGGALALRAHKGNYCQGEPFDVAQPYETVWFELGGAAGGVDQLAARYRNFVLCHLAEHVASRKPYIFYNTWNYQERVKHWKKQDYLSEMNQARMEREIEVAARMGVDVFVIDTGWYEKTGDWRVSGERFERGLEPLEQKLDSSGMELGLWFGPLHAAKSSDMLAAHRDCLMQKQGESAEQGVWGTETSQNLCLSTRFADAFADELVRLHRELGVSYFKWDGIGQYGCDATGHGHGDETNSPEERADRYAFLLPLRLTRVVERLSAHAPQAIVDFDVTEAGRAVGLAFLAAGKYFWINNGPYAMNYDLPGTSDDNPNLFFWPGEARSWICRQSLALDRWIPSALFLVHYLPDDPAPRGPDWFRPSGFADSLEVVLASMMLGHGGFWGDLTAVSEDGVQRIAASLARFKTVRDAITRAAPCASGAVGSSPEIHEKLHEGRGLLAIFAAHRGQYEYVTSGAVVDGGWCADSRGGGTLEVERLADGRARVRARFDRPGARAILFGCESEQAENPQPRG